MPRKCQPVGSNITIHYNFLNKISQRRRSSKFLHRIIREATVPQLLCCVEIAINLLKDKFSLTTRQKARLEPFVSTLRRLARAKTPRSVAQLLHSNLALIDPLITPILKSVKR